ncbi:MAG TPA: Bax inhibitor-1/YccA family protein [Verrucomicrobiae bacterium]|nr:Bax inhibitor-1/YccA family protein [Verrucomicrobiae bacterium]
MRTANPALNENTFEGLRARGDATMTINGTVTKSAILLALLVGAASYTWDLLKTGGNVGPWVLGGALGGFIVAMVTVFKKEWSPVTAPIYAILEGLFLGAISAIFAARFEGIVFQAVTLTFGVFFSLLLAYQTRLIKATENFKLGVFAATGGICLIYLVGFVMSFFGTRIPYIHESGWIGIGFSVFVVVIAALNLVLDFDFIEQGAERRAPKYMEWYASFGLLVTLVWLYIEILRLLSKLRNR